MDTNDLMNQLRILTTLGENTTIKIRIGDKDYNIKDINAHTNVIKNEQTVYLLAEVIDEEEIKHYAILSNPWGPGDHAKPIVGFCKGKLSELLTQYPTHKYELRQMKEIDEPIQFGINVFDHCDGIQVGKFSNKKLQD